MFENDHFFFIYKTSGPKHQQAGKVSHLILVQTCTLRLLDATEGNAGAEGSSGSQHSLGTKNLEHGYLKIPSEHGLTGGQDYIARDTVSSLQHTRAHVYTDSCTRAYIGAYACGKV